MKDSASSMAGGAVLEAGAANKESFEAMRDEFYRLRGWDPETGIPKTATLKSLGLYEVAEEIALER